MTANQLLTSSSSMDKENSWPDGNTMQGIWVSSIIKKAYRKNSLKVKPKLTQAFIATAYHHEHRN